MYSVMLVTTKNVREAKKIAKALLAEKLVACANIVKGVESLFWWEGKINQANEVLLILKTRKSLVKRVVKMVKKLHSYSVPEIIALEIKEGYNPYHKWINDSTLKGGLL